MNGTAKQSSSSSPSSSTSSPSSSTSPPSTTHNNSKPLPKINTAASPSSSLPSSTTTSTATTTTISSPPTSPKQQQRQQQHQNALPDPLSENILSSSDLQSHQYLSSSTTAILANNSSFKPSLSSVVGPKPSGHGDEELQGYLAEVETTNMNTSESSFIYSHDGDGNNHHPL